MPEDWAGYLAAVQALVAGPVELTDDELLLATVHLSRLERAAYAQATARALPGVPFRDWTTPWDAGLLGDLPALAHLEGVRLGPDALARLVSDPVALAGLARTAADAAVLYAALAVGEAQVALVEQARRRLRTRPALDEHLAEQGYGRGFEQRWTGVPDGYDERASEWNRLALRLFVYPALGEDDYDEQLARLPDELWMRPQERYVGDAELWLGELEEAWFELVMDLDLELQSAGGQRAPWTEQAWDVVELMLVVRDGPARTKPADVNDLNADGPRQLLIEVPLDPAGLLPLEAALDALMGTTAAALLEQVPDLTEPARALLRERAGAPSSAGSAQD